MILLFDYNNLSQGIGIQMHIRSSSGILYETNLQILMYHIFLFFFLIIGSLRSVYTFSQITPTHAVLYHISVYILWPLEDHKPLKYLRFTSLSQQKSISAPLGTSLSPPHFENAFLQPKWLYQPRAWAVRSCFRGNLREYSYILEPVNTHNQ